MSDEKNTVVDVTVRGSIALSAVDSMTLVKLKEELRKRNLKVSGKKEELQDRLKAALREEIEGHEYDRDAVTECISQLLALTFKDVEESLNTFSGDNKSHLLEEFEEMAELCKWNDERKVIHAKRLLRGVAKMFVNYMQCCWNWSEMREALRKEISQVVDELKIHRELSERVKKSSETLQEYMYHMLELAKQADIEESAVIKYIIDGIQDEESNKRILYGANIQELKEKFKLDEDMKENSRTESQQTEKKAKKTTRETKE